MAQASGKSGADGGRPGLQRVRGFTVIEVVTVLVILGIVTALVVSRVNFQRGGLNARLSEIRSQLRYLQLESMKQNIPMGLGCDGTNYWAYFTANSTKFSLPAETQTNITLSSKSMTMGSFYYSFDANGVPYTGSGATPTKLSSAASISITVDGATGTLTLTPETGFVP